MWISVLEFQAHDHGLHRLGQRRKRNSEKSRDPIIRGHDEHPEGIARITRWVRQEGRLEQFQLMLEVEATIGRERRVEER